MMSQRNQLQGYEHPTEEKSYTTRSAIYKTFTEGKKAKKNETFGITGTESQYSTFQVPRDDVCMLCPECNERAVLTCNCVYMDKTCKNNHNWYTNRSGEKCTGNPHKNV